MTKNHLILLLIVGLIMTGVTSAIAAQKGAMRHRENSVPPPLAQIDLSAEQAEQIRKLRLAHEKSIAPLKIKKQQLKAELEILWLQMTPDAKKIKSAQKEIHDIRFRLLEKETDFRVAVRKILTQDQLTRFLALNGDRYHGPDNFGHRPHLPPQPIKYSIRSFFYEHD